MAAVSLFWNTNMAAVTSCENALYLRPRLQNLANGFFFISYANETKQQQQQKTYDVIKQKKGVSRDTANSWGQLEPARVE